MKEKICECGDAESQHVDGCEMCVVPECGCREFQEREEPLDRQFSKEQEAIIERTMKESEAELDYQ